jgi:hypothetical protein
MWWAAWKGFFQLGMIVAPGRPLANRRWYATTGFAIICGTIANTATAALPHSE